MKVENGRGFLAAGHQINEVLLFKVDLFCFLRFLHCGFF